MQAFVPGIEVCRAFYTEVVGPAIDTAFPRLTYAAALIGDGSEVLGFDSEMSTDHAWAPRIMLFLPEPGADTTRSRVGDVLAGALPEQFRGYPVAVLWPTGTPRHRIDMHTIPAYFGEYLGYDVRRDPEPTDWLTFPQQKLRAVTAGAVFCDGIGLQEVRARLAYYPRDVWLYLMASGWTRIGQEEHLMGRAGISGDEVGSAIIGARLVHDIMWLCFLMDRTYAPYAKWFGAAFARLTCAAQIMPALRGALAATSWLGRQENLCAAYEKLAQMHNLLGITEPLPARVVQFHSRPFRVIEFDGRFAEALRGAIQDPEVRRIASGRMIGGIDQISDNTDILSESAWRPALARLYD